MTNDQKKQQLLLKYLTRFERQQAVWKQKKGGALRRTKDLMTKDKKILAVAPGT